MHDTPNPNATTSDRKRKLCFMNKKSQQQHTLTLPPSSLSAKNICFKNHQVYNAEITGAQKDAEKNTNNDASPASLHPYMLITDHFPAPRQHTSPIHWNDCLRVSDIAHASGRIHVAASYKNHRSLIHYSGV